MAIADITCHPSETPIFSADFHPRLILRHIDEGLVITDKRVIVRVPRTIFGFLLMGYQERSASLDSVDTVVAGKGADGRQLAGGATALVLGFLVLVWGTWFAGPGPMQTVLGLVLLAVGIVRLLTAFDTVVGITTVGAQTVTVSAGGGEEAQRRRAADLLTLVSTQRTAATPAPQHQ